jgi:uncharacterized protein
VHADTQTPSDVFFSPSVKAVQARRGSREAYARVAAGGGFRTAITSEVASWIEDRDSFYLSSASAAGQPYIQHRGGPRGFLKVLDEHTLGFADYRGNRQFITLGNLAENDQVMLFLMDYQERARTKIWGRAEVVENDPELLARLTPEGVRGKPEQAILIHVSVWDTNCHQHIPQKFDAASVVDIVRGLKEKVAELEAEVARLKEGK